MTRPPFQYDKPVFVRNPNGLLMSGKRYAKGDLVPWKERGLPLSNIERMYNEHHLHHNEDMEEAVKAPVGDGLDEMSVEQLHILVKTINAKVKAKTSNEAEFLGTLRLVLMCQFLSKIMSFKNFRVPPDFSNVPLFWILLVPQILLTSLVVTIFT